VKKIIEFHATLLVDEEDTDRVTNELLDSLDQQCACMHGADECSMIVGGTRVRDHDEWARELEADEEENENPPRRRRRKKKEDDEDDDLTLEAVIENLKQRDKAKQDLAAL